MRLLAINFISLAIIVPLSALAQIQVHSKSIIDSDAKLITATSQACCECRKPPGGKHCCDATDFVGCVVKNNQCECTCFATNLKRLPEDVARDIFKTLIGDKANDIVTPDYGRLLNRVITASEKGKNYELHFETGEQYYLTLTVPPSARQDLMWFRERVPPADDDMFDHQRLRKQ
jgi:hypothetical protein